MFNKTHKRGGRGMKKTLRNIISTVLMLSMLTLAIGCTNVGTNTDKDNNNSLAQIVNSSANSDINIPDNGNQSAANPEVNTSALDFGENSFASKIEGTYFGMDEGDMPFYLSIYNFCGNVYAYGGYTAEEDEEEVKGHGLKDHRVAISSIDELTNPKQEEEYKQAVKENWTDINEKGCYNAAMVVKKGPGLYPIVDYCGYYIFNKKTETYDNKEIPKEMKGINLG